MSRTPEQLSTSTLFYLFATEWLPHDPTAVTAAVPGGRVSMCTAYANLVDVVVWNLVRKNMVRVIPLRPLDDEPVVAMGGQSFCRLATVQAPEAVQGAAAGLEARVLELVGSAEGERDNDLRDVLRRLALLARAPWPSVVNLPYTELVQAEMVQQRGWMRKRMEVTSPEKVERARIRFDQRRDERSQHLQRHRAEHDAVIADGLAAVQWMSTRPRS